MRFYPIRTQRLRLRKPRMTDEARLMELLEDPSVSRYIPLIPYPYRRKDALAYLKRVQRFRQNAEHGRGYDYFIEMDGVVVGSAHLSWNAKQKRALFGYWVGKPFRG